MSTVVTSENLDLPDRIFFARVALTRRFVCRDGYTPMICAISKYSIHGNMTIQKMAAVCQLLILSGANVNSRDKAYASKRIVFFHICASSYAFMTISLPRGCTALHAAAKKQLVDVCHLLIDNRADLNARDGKKECGQYI